MLAVGAVAGGVRQPDAPVATTSTSPVPQQAGALMVGADVAANIRALQSRLSTVPQDWSAWASLGGLYTTQARLTWRPGRETERPRRQSTRVYRAAASWVRPSEVSRSAADRAAPRRHGPSGSASGRMV